MDAEFKKLIDETISYWIGKKDNPLNGKTFNEIGQLAKKYGPDLKGYIA